MSHFADLSQAISQVNSSFTAICDATQHGTRAGVIKRGLAAQILQDLLSIVDTVDLHRHVTCLGGSSRNVTEFQGEYPELIEL